MFFFRRVDRRGSLEVDGDIHAEEESGGLLTGLNTSGNLYIGIKPATYSHYLVNTCPPPTPSAYSE